MNTWEVNHRAVWQLAWPMILSNLSTPLLGLVDTAILGHLPQAKYLAAVALGAALVTFVFWSFGFLRMGTTSLVARTVGAGDSAAVKQILWRSIKIALLLSALLYLLQWWLLPWAIGFMSEPSSARDLALSYCQIRMLAAPATLVNYVLIGWFVGRQNTRIPLLLMVTLNALNIIFDLILVWWLGFGSDGAAWASVGAEYGCILLGLLVLAKQGGLRPIEQNKAVDRWQQLRALLAINGHLFIRTAALLSVTLFFTVQGAHMGTVVVAANAILMQLVAMISYGLDGYAHAAEALVGRATGAGRLSLFRKAVNYTALWSLLTALGLSALLALAGEQTILWFTDLPEVVEVAQSYYGWLVVFPLLSMAAYHLDGVFLGWGRADVMQISMLVSAVGVFFPVWWLGEGNSGLWMAFIAFNVSRGVLLASFLGLKLRNQRVLPRSI